MNTVALIIAALAIVIAAVAVWVALDRRRVQRVRTQFGPEYDRVYKEEGNARRAAAVLEKRAERIEKLHIRPLSERERTDYAEAWRIDQAGFVDDPPTAVERADELVIRVMKAKGYPMADFEQRVADISVEHSRAVENYRLAHRVAVMSKQGQANTEDLRQAMKHYRALFEDLLDQRVHEKEEIHR